jgi:hypothetical protein
MWVTRFHSLLPILIILLQEGQKGVIDRCDEELGIAMRELHAFRETDKSEVLCIIKVQGSQIGNFDLLR